MSTAPELTLPALANPLPSRIAHLLLAILLGSLLTAKALAADFHTFVRNGHTIEYVVELPEHFDKSKPYPVLLALPPGDQSKQLVQAGLELYWEDESRTRGWVIVSPAAPEGTSFDNGLEKELPALLDEVAKTVTFEGAKAHLAGISNGGRSAYRLITEYPERFLSLTVLPGVPPEDTTTADLQRLKGIPIAAFAGGEDAGWAAKSHETKAKLDQLGIENTLEIVPGESHVIRLDPATLFDLLDSRRPNRTGAEKKGDTSQQ